MKEVCTLRLKILHTNDLHGLLDHWPLISKFIEENQSLASVEVDAHPTIRVGDALACVPGVALRTIDVGDAMDSVHPLVEATYGKVIVDLFNEANYDVVTLGNNEGLNFSKERLSDLYDRADYSVTIANLFDKDTKEVPSYAENIVYKEIDDMKVAFIGLTAPYGTY